MLDLFKITAAALSSTAKAVLLGARGLGDETDDASAEPADDVFYPGPLGLLVLPTVRRTLRALVARVGGPTDMIALALWDKAIAHSPSPSAGETRLYAAGWPNVCLRLFNGFVEVRVGSGSGVLKLAPDGAGWADKHVARVDDTVNVGTVTAMAGPYPVTFSYTPAVGAPSAGATLNLNGGKITSGSSSVKA